MYMETNVLVIEFLYMRKTIIVMANNLFCLMEKIRKARDAPYPHIGQGKGDSGDSGKRRQKTISTDTYPSLSLSVHLRVQIESIYLTRLTTQIDLVLVIQCEILHLLEASRAPRCGVF